MNNFNVKFERDFITFLDLCLASVVEELAPVY